MSHLLPPLIKEQPEKEQSIVASFARLNHFLIVSPLQIVSIRNERTFAFLGCNFGKPLGIFFKFCVWNSSNARYQVVCANGTAGILS
jgi:hypothetical protein